MVVIVVGQSKGGVGKTTLAVNLAGDIARHGHSVTLIDADPQGSAADWAEPGGLSFPVRAELLAEDQPLVWVRDVLKTGSDYLVVDLAAGLGASFAAAALIADLLVVPCGPSSIDLNAAQKTIVEARRIRRRELPAGDVKIVTLATRVHPDTEEGRQIGEALAELGEPVAPALSFDVRHGRAFADGSTVAGVDGAGGAAEEVSRLSLFLLRQVLPRQGVFGRADTIGLRRADAGRP